MSISTQPLPPLPTPPPRGISITTLFLSLALAVSVTAAVILAVLYSRQPGSAGGGGGGGALAAIFGEEALVQKDTVSPQGKYTGVVYYPMPYGSPPNLKLTAPKRQYDIVKQDETGFTWMALPALEDIKDEWRKDFEAGGSRKPFDLLLGQTWFKPNLQFEDFTWEAKGVRATKEALAMRPFEQTGKFNTIVGKEGEVNFPIPYAVAPGVELSGSPSGVVIIVESRPTGFKWKNGGDNAIFHNGEVTYIAKGIRATEVPKGGP